VPRTDGGYQFGEPSGIVEIPVSWSWDDFRRSSSSRMTEVADEYRAQAGQAG
jgi:hypothetical protein